MLTDPRFHANAWRFDNHYNPIPQDFTIHHQFGITSMSSEVCSSSPAHPSCQNPSISNNQHPSMGMPLDGCQDDDEFAKFHQQFMNFAKADDTHHSTDDTNRRTDDANFGNCKENCMAIDLSRTPDFSRFQEVINFNNRFQEDLNFNRSVYPEFGYSVPHPQYSTCSVNNSDRSLVIKNRQNSNIRQAPYQRIGAKNRRCSITDDVSSSVDADNPQRSLANDRERARTRNLNVAFAELRTRVPSMPSDKLSKIQTLRLASKYIHFLLHVLREGLGEDDVVDVAWNRSRLLTHERLGKKFSMWRLQGAWAS